MLLPFVLALVLPACGRSGCNESSGRILGPPLAAVDGVAYAAEGGALSALNAASGALAWRHSTSGGVTTPLVMGGAVIAGTGDGTLVAFHVSDGSVVWHSQPVGRPWSGYSPGIPDPVLSGDVVYAAVSPDSIAAWSISDGTLLWQSPPLTVPTEPGYTSGYAPVPEPVAVTDAVYFSAGQSVRAVRASDGSLLQSSPSLQSTNIYTPPVLADGRIFVATPDGSLYALGADSGAVLWHMSGLGGPTPQDVSSPHIRAPPVVQDGEVYYTSSGGVQVLAADTGKVLWHLSDANSNVGQDLQIVGGVAYVTTGGAQNLLWALDARIGRIRWTVSDAPVEGGGLLVSGDAVYTWSTTRILAFGASNRSSLWQRWVQSGAAYLGHVIAVDSAVYFSLSGVGLCAGDNLLPTVRALRASDGALLWQTPVAGK